MGWADGLGQVLQNVLGGKASEADVHSAFDKVASAAPHGELAQGLSHVFNSDQTPPFEQMIGGLGGLASVLQGGGAVTPAQAQEISPAAVEAMAKKAQQANPGVVDSVSGFYAKNPQLVKAIGAGALALLMSRLAKRGTS